jgi:GNAT superfamily N-acetyltransferase
MEIIRTQKLTPHQAACINAMWNAAYPLKLKDRFPILLDGAVSFNHYIIEDTNHNVLAWAVDFKKDNEQLRFSIIVSAGQQGKGLGGKLIDKLKQENKEFYGWVIDHNEDKKSDGTAYQSPMPFYLKHGFEILPDNRIDTEMIRAVLIKWSSAKQQ